MSFLDHAKRELQTIGWLDKDFNIIDEDDNIDGPNHWMVNNLYELLNVLENQNHSGFSHSWIMYLFARCANFQPLSNLTGESDEWMQVDNNGSMFQNKRCGNIFYNGFFAYNLDGYVFKEPYFDEDEGKYSINSFTNIYSRKIVEFPFDPVQEGKPIYIAVPEDCPREDLPYWIKQIDQYYVNPIELEEELNNNIIELCHGKKYKVEKLQYRRPDDFANRIVDFCLTGK